MPWKLKHYEYGIVYTQMGSVPPAGGGAFPQVKLIFGKSPDYQTVRVEALMEFGPAMRQLELDLNVRVAPDCGYMPLGGITYFYQPVYDMDEGTDGEAEA
jgi:hypothetical protein